MLNYFTVDNIISLLKLVLDIGIVSVVIYYSLNLVKNNSRTIQIAKGIIFVFILNWVAQQLELRTIELLITQFLNWGFLVIFIIFQPELRALLEKLGRTTVFSSISSLNKDEKEYLVDELVKTVDSLSKSRTGALITLEQTNSLADYIRTGTSVNSEVSAELLGSIFVPGTPLHDGAVIIQGNRIASASSFYPPTARELPSQLGARHRAAIGLSEITDSITIIVSEESGKVSIAQNGKLTVLNTNQLKAFLMVVLGLEASGDSDQEIEHVVEAQVRKERKKGKIKAEKIVVKKPSKDGGDDNER